MNNRTKIGIILLFITFVCFIIQIMKYENMGNLKSFVNKTNNKNNIDNKNKTIDPLKKTIIQPIDLLEYKAFSDVIFYRSEPIFGGLSGRKKCMKNCNGTCLDFGYTNDSLCFPKKIDN
jgi:hypothetical protein